VKDMLDGHCARACMEVGASASRQDSTTNGVQYFFVLPLTYDDDDACCRGAAD
jgi:hypothetical protein